MAVNLSLAAHHGVRLARAGLAIHEYGTVEALETRQHDLAHCLLVDVSVAVTLTIDQVECKLALLLLAQHLRLAVAGASFRLDRLGHLGGLHGGGWHLRRRSLARRPGDLLGLVALLSHKRSTRLRR